MKIRNLLYTLFVPIDEAGYHPIALIVTSTLAITILWYDYYLLTNLVFK